MELLIYTIIYFSFERFNLAFTLLKMDNNNCISLIISLNDAHLYSNEISIKKKKF